MKNYLILIFFFSSFMMKPADTDPLAALEGTWYVNLSNFKMWLKGNKHNPAFTYTLAEKKGKRGLKDVVSFTKKGKSKQIVGFDKPENEQATTFTWRGKGLLALFKSKWEIVYSTQDWTLIHFEKTLATAEGYDVISRTKNFSPETMVAIKAKLKELGVPKLVLISQQ
jgi:hypothetical protein